MLCNGAVDYCDERSVTTPHNGRIQTVHNGVLETSNDISALMETSLTSPAYFSRVLHDYLSTFLDIDFLSSEMNQDRWEEFSLKFWHSVSETILSKRMKGELPNNPNDGPLKLLNIQEISDSLIGASAEMGTEIILDQLARDHDSSDHGTIQLMTRENYCSPDGISLIPFKKGCQIDYYSRFNSIVKKDGAKRMETDAIVYVQHLLGNERTLTTYYFLDPSTRTNFKKNKMERPLRLEKLIKKKDATVKIADINIIYMSETTQAFVARPDHHDIYLPARNVILQFANMGSKILFNTTMNKGLVKL
jgi:hypothetical protein